MALYPLLMSLGIGGGIFGTIYYVIDIIKGKIQAKLTCRVTIKHTDETFKWVNKFMKDKKLIKNDGTLRCKIKIDDAPWWESIFKPKKGKPDLDYSPGAGMHIFEFNGKSFWVSHNIGETLITGWERQPTEMEDLTIMTWGNDTSHIKNFIDACVVHNMKTDKNAINIYELHHWGIGWTKVQSKKPRPMSSVILDSDLSSMLVQDITKFQNSMEWYLSKGVPYRRGYLLYGPPGTGKTSFTQAIAGLMNLNICYLNLSGDRLDDDSLNRALNEAPAHSIILLEDIDGIFVEREAVNTQ